VTEITISSVIRTEVNVYEVILLHFAPTQLQDRISDATKLGCVPIINIKDAFFCVSVLITHIEYGNSLRQK
jgi:hypothetical protein